MSTTLPDTSPTVNEIAAARAEMGHALFAIADRLAPKKLIARLKDQAKLRMTSKVEELKERANPADLVRRKVGGESPEVITTRAGEGGRPALSR